MLLVFVMRSEMSAFVLIKKKKNETRASRNLAWFGLAYQKEWNQGETACLGLGLGLGLNLNLSLSLNSSVPR